MSGKSEIDDPKVKAEFLEAIMKFPPGPRRDRGLAIHRRMGNGLTSDELVAYAMNEVVHVMSSFADCLSEAVDKLEGKAC